MQRFDKMNENVAPEMAAIDALVASPLWEEIKAYLEGRQKALHRFEYSRCSAPGWNVKYRKGGRALCTLYPEEGWFICLVVIGQRELPEFERLLPTLSDHTQRYYEKKKDKAGGCWLMLRRTA